MPEVDALQLAKDYAETRWMLDDPSLIEEVMTGISPGDIIEEIDRLAEKNDLDDPFSGWMLSSEDVEARKAKIQGIQRKLNDLAAAGKAAAPR